MTDQKPTGVFRVPEYRYHGPALTPAQIAEMLEHGERRAEQRVRAEIGRDSERLDWLERACVHAYEPKQYENGVGCGVCRVSHRPDEARDLRAAIDAAREVG